MSNGDKRAAYARRAEEAREAAKASANDQLKLVLYQIARLWDRLAQSARILVATAATATASCAAVMTECCLRMHFHCPCCWLHI